MKKGFAAAALVLLCILTSCGVAFTRDGHVQFLEQLNIDKTGFSTNGRDLLDERLQASYDALSEGIYQLQTDIKIKDVSQKEVKKLVEYFKTDNPQVFWLDNDYGYEYNVLTKDISGLNLNYFYTNLDTGEEVVYSNQMVEEMNLQIQAETRLILGGITEDMGEYEKVKYIHDYLAVNIKYDEGASFQHNIYGALVEKRAVCDGFSNSFQYLLTQLGIESRIAYGDSVDGVAHAWNVVRIDGEYYHVDVTWDVPLENSSMALYTYFNLDDETVQRSRVIYSPFIGEKSDFDHYLPIPHCTSDRYNYYKYNNMLVQNYDETGLDHIITTLNEAVDAGKTEIQMMFESTGDFQRFISEVTEGNNQKFKKFPYSTGSRKTSITTSDEANLVIFKFAYGDQP